MKAELLKGKREFIPTAEPGVCDPCGGSPSNPSIAGCAPKGHNHLY